MPDDVVMATKTLIVDDLDGSDDASTVSFSLGNMAYEIDLSKKNKAAMEKKLSKFTAVARKAGSSGRRKGSRSASRPQTGAIRGQLHRVYHLTEGRRPGVKVRQATGF